MKSGIAFYEHLAYSAHKEDPVLIKYFIKLEVQGDLGVIGEFTAGANRGV